ncbi:MAG: hypothetical protein H6502_05645 [Candidatus Woesearchaeota archaeon]|nr:MAG: hypothetical protein H6502_05645 [Candidatus Woesearchaeota archaeon]
MKIHLVVVFLLVVLSVFLLSSCTESDGGINETSTAPQIVLDHCTCECVLENETSRVLEDRVCAEDFCYKNFFIKEDDCLENTNDYV